MKADVEKLLKSVGYDITKIRSSHVGFMGDNVAKKSLTWHGTQGDNRRGA
jgi:predicted RNA binding protein YcfA (HicA-like mRNA interferase family)